MSVIKSIFSVRNNCQTITAGYDCPSRQQTQCQEGTSKSLFCKSCIISKFSLSPPTILSTLFSSCLTHLSVYSLQCQVKTLYLLCKRIIGDRLVLPESLSFFLFFLLWYFEFLQYKITNLIASFYFPICPRVPIA